MGIDVASYKRMLREQQKARRDSISAARRREIEAELLERLLLMPEVCAAGTVATYRAFGSEFNLSLPWPEKLVYPISLTGGQMEFARIPQGKTPDWLAKPWKAIATPPEHVEPVPTSHIDVFLVPGLAFDDAGMRLGYGGGYYDRYLAREDRKGVAIGVGLALEVGTIPCEDHDVAMDATVLVRQPPQMRIHAESDT